MDELPFQIERYIVKQGACEESAETIAEEMQHPFLRDSVRCDARTYNPERAAPVLRWDFRDLYSCPRRDVVDENASEGDGSCGDVETTDGFDDGPVDCGEKNGMELALISHEDGCTASSHPRTHKRQSLCESDRSDVDIEGPLRRATFDVRTDQPMTSPATNGVETFEGGRRFR